MIQPVQRLVCSRCLRPQQTCICQWITSIAHVVEVLILQHPLEAGHAKGSARLLHLSLLNSRMVVGEAFEEQELQALLYAPFEHQSAPGLQVHARKQAVLLYPDTPNGARACMAEPAVLEETALADPSQLRLVVVDGTWRKSRKMIYANSLLQTLPRLALRDVPASQYLIRKAHGEHQLSTLEATCYALMRLEKNDEKFVPLLKTFNGFVAQQLGQRSLNAPSSLRQD